MDEYEEREKMRKKIKVTFKEVVIYKRGGGKTWMKTKNEQGWKCGRKTNERGREAIYIEGGAGEVWEDGEGGRKKKERDKKGGNE